MARAEPIVGRALFFDLSQIAFVGLTIAAVVILFGAIEQGLVSHPDMRVVGNGSNDQLLRWYQDRTEPLLPRPGLCLRRSWSIAARCWPGR